MGIVLTTLQDALAQIGQKESKVAMIGLDAAGKTTAVYQIKLTDTSEAIPPTIGFAVETLQYKNLNITIWDVGGGDKIRPLWDHYYKSADAVIFMVDSSDGDRLVEAREELHKVLRHNSLGEAKILIYANKQDLPEALSPSDLADKLRLHGICQEWRMQSTVATSGDGLCEGLDWLSSEL